jgi:hypothetical protein
LLRRREKWRLFPFFVEKENKERPRKAEKD